MAVPDPVAMGEGLVIGSAVVYLGLLFGIAWWTERRGTTAQRLLRSPSIYALSMAVYCTAWTYFGSVGRAATDGIEALAIYIGATAMAFLFVPVLRKMVRVSRTLRITSLADLISTRYGKNFSVAIAVTLLCVVGIIPYIALQLKAVTQAIDLITEPGSQRSWLLADGALLVTVLLCVFLLVFGARSVDATEKHDGMVVAVAFESLVKLVAILLVGGFVTFGLFQGFGDLFAQASSRPELRELFTLRHDDLDGSWTGTMLLACGSLLLLPRQFQVSVIENVNEQHIAKATWLFPLYLLLINLFVLPLALGGRLLLDPSIPGDTYILALPMAHGHEVLGLITFLGGFSAATGMILVETIALGTMLSNNVAMPFLLKARDFRTDRTDRLSSTVLFTRRMSIILILAAAYLYARTIAQHATLVSIGLVSFVAVIQLTPAVFGGLYWRSGSQRGAMAGLVVGSALWVYTLVLPQLADAGLVPGQLITEGPWGIAWLKPYALLGMQGLDPLVHGLFWSLLVNMGLYILISLRDTLRSREAYYAEVFVNIDHHTEATGPSNVWRGTAYVPDLRALLINFIEPERVERSMGQFARRNNISLDGKGIADPRLVMWVERALSGIIGAASARIMVASVAKEEELTMEEVLGLLRGSQQLMSSNKDLRRQSDELDRLARALQEANEGLKRSDELKDEFLYTVTHELRTPLTSIRALSEILHDTPDIVEEQRQQFLATMVRETERLTRLIEQVLDLEKLESGKQKLNEGSILLPALIDEAVDSVGQLLRDKGISIQLDVQRNMRPILGDADRIEQVLINLLSNAVKFCPEEEGHITVSCYYVDNEVKVHVTDNGPGVEPASRKLIFDKFFQARQHHQRRNTSGSGLGLAICRNIVVLHGGRIWVESNTDQGARFSFTLPAISPTDNTSNA
jgi:signal transduction histidine kinase/Na+/proline symporter